MGWQGKEMGAKAGVVPSPSELRPLLVSWSPHSALQTAPEGRLSCGLDWKDGRAGLQDACCNSLTRTAEQPLLSACSWSFWLLKICLFILKLKVTVRDRKRSYIHSSYASWRIS